MNKPNSVQKSEASGVHSPSRAAGASHKPERRLLRVWVAEANPALRELFAHLLSRQPGFRCTRQFAGTGPLLAALADERPPDLLVLDVHLNGAADFGAVRTIKKAAPTVRVLMSALFGNSHYEAEAHRAGATGFLLKTFEIEEIAAYLRTAYQEPSAEILFPNLALLKRLEREQANRAIAAKATARRQPLDLIAALRDLYRSHRPTPG